MADELLTSFSSSSTSTSSSNSIRWINTMQYWGSTGGSPCLPIASPAPQLLCSGSVSDIASLFADSPAFPFSEFGLPSPTIDWSDPLIIRAQNSSPHPQLQAPKPFFQEQAPDVESRPSPIHQADQGEVLLQAPNLSSYFQGPEVEQSQAETMHGLILNPNPPSGVHLLHDLPRQGGAWSKPQVGSRSSGCFVSTSGQLHEENTSSTSSSSSGGKRKVVMNKGEETTAKRARIQMPSPLPTFHVRKEKLQDRVTALQQLVSPFGKTDTASVLHEAIEYIKFLHDQVRVLSAPYLKTGQQQASKGLKPDLRSQGLCMVPISSTFGIAQEPISDFFWATNNINIGASFR